MQKRGKKKKTRLFATNESILMDFLLAKMGGMSRTSIKSLLSHRQVQVNGHIETKYNAELKNGDEIVIITSSANTELVHPKLKIIYEDNDLIVVEKKEGLLTVATTPESRETTVFSILKRYVTKIHSHNKIFIVHRLDRETSGLLVFAKNKEIQEFMRNNWKKIVTNRTYVALLEGDIKKENDTVVSWLTENQKTTRVYSSFSDNGGKKSITHYKKLMSNKNFSLVELTLETGRTNQIRVQMAAIGNAVVGDRKYGSGINPIIDRLALHAYILDFVHPKTKEELKFQLPIPKSFTKIFGKESK